MHWQFQTDNVFDILIFQNFHEYLLLYMLNTNYVFSFTSSLLWQNPILHWKFSVYFRRFVCLRKQIFPSLTSDKVSFPWFNACSKNVLFFYRNADGCTVFMQAVRSCAYAAALVVLDTAKKVATNESGWLDRATFMQMLYPTGSSLDNSPLQMLCCNDTCSFTWTGREHIKQVRLSYTCTGGQKSGSLSCKGLFRWGECSPTVI